MGTLAEIIFGGCFSTRSELKALHEDIWFLKKWYFGSHKTTKIVPVTICYQYWLPLQILVRCLGYYMARIHD